MAHRTKPMSDDELGRIIEEELAQASGDAGGKLAELREQALDYYYNRTTIAPAVAGRSAVQSTDLADMVESVTAQMMPAFAGDGVAQFEPRSQDDEDQAAMESLFVAAALMDGNDGYTLIQETIKDALLQMNGIAKVWIDEKRDTFIHKAEGLDTEGLVDVLIPRTAEEEIRIINQEPAGGVEGSELWDVTIERVVPRKALKVRAVAPENWRFQQDWTTISLQGIRFCAERELQTRSALVDQGYTIETVYALGAHTMHTDGQTQARHDLDTAQLGGQEAATELVETWDVYILADVDGTGVAQQRRVLYAGTDGLGGGGLVLDNIEVELIPYSTGVAIVRPHEFNGISLHEKLKQTQDIKTEGLRQWLDNLRVTNNRRIAYREGAVDATALYTSKPGGGIACRDPHADLNPIPVDDIGPSILQLLGYMDGVRTEQAGASLELINSEQQIAVTSGASAESQYLRKEMLAAMMCRNIAETLIRSLYLLIHATMRQGLGDELSMRTADGQWVQSTPGEWEARDQVNVKAGLSVGERAHKKATLEQVIALQKDVMQNGLSGQLTDPSRAYQAIIDHGHASMLPNPEQYWIDPSSDAAQQAAQEAQAQEAQQGQQVADLQLQLATMQVSFEKFRTEEELRFKYFAETLRAELKEAELVVKGADAELAARTDMATTLITERATARARLDGAPAPAPGGNGDAG